MFGKSAKIQITYRIERTPISKPMSLIHIKYLNINYIPKVSQTHQVIRKQLMIDFIVFFLLLSYFRLGN